MIFEPTYLKVIELKILIDKKLFFIESTGKRIYCSDDMYNCSNCPVYARSCNHDDTCNNITVIRYNKLFNRILKYKPELLL